MPKQVGGRAVAEEEGAKAGHVPVVLGTGADGVVADDDDIVGVLVGDELVLDPRQLLLDGVIGGSPADGMDRMSEDVRM